MPFLRRSKSQLVKVAKQDAENLNKPLPFDEDAPAPPSKPGDAALEANTLKSKRRQSLFGSTAPENVRAILRRPSTAQARHQELGIERIEIEECGALFAFPTPSPRMPPNVPPKSASIPSATPSPLGGNPPTPGIGSTFEAALENRPARGRAKTTNNAAVVAKLPARPLPVRAHTGIAEPTMSSARPELRRKKSSWRTLGGLFSRRAPDQGSGLHSQKQREPQVESALHLPQTQPLLVTPQPSPASLRHSSTISPVQTRSPSCSKNSVGLKARAEADGTSLVPHSERKMRLSTSTSSQRSSYIPPIHPNTRIADPHAKSKPLSERQDSPVRTDHDEMPWPSRPQLPALPLRLDLDIPNSELERYSIMFEKLLTSRQSIVDRRRSRSRRSLNSASREIVDQVPALPPKDFKDLKMPSKSPRRQRSVSSPQFKPLPTLAIRVENSKCILSEDVNQQRDIGGASAGCVRPVQRSHTCPPGSISPVTRGHPHPKSGNMATYNMPAILSSEGEPSLSPSSLLEPENSLPPTPSTATTCSYADGDEVVEVINAYTLPRHHRDTSKHILQPPKPTLEMLTPSKYVPQQAPVSDMQTALAPRRSVDGKPLAPRVQSPQELEERMVQVSVARQVSVSRARRHLERAASTKPYAQSLRPKVVDIDVLKQRKSMMVKVESGDGH